MKGRPIGRGIQPDCWLGKRLPGAGGRPMGRGMTPRWWLGNAPPILFLFLTKRERAVHGPREKNASAGRSAQADSSSAGGRRLDVTSRPVQLKRVSLGESSSPGKARILPAPSPAAAPLAVAGLGVLPGPGTLRCRARVAGCSLRVEQGSFGRSSCQAHGRPRAKRVGRLPERRGSGSGARRGGVSGTSPRLLPDRQPRKRRSETAGVDRAR